MAAAAPPRHCPPTLSYLLTPANQATIPSRCIVVLWTGARHNVRRAGRRPEPDMESLESLRDFVDRLGISACGSCSFGVQKLQRRPVAVPGSRGADHRCWGVRNFASQKFDF